MKVNILSSLKNLRELGNLKNLRDLGNLKNWRDSETMKQKAKELRHGLIKIRASLRSIRNQVKNPQNPPKQ